MSPFVSYDIVFNQAEAFGSTEKSLLLIKRNHAPCACASHDQSFALRPDSWPSAPVPVTINHSRCDVIVDSLLEVLPSTVSHALLQAGVVRQSQVMNERER
jgi:hypothetical protein